MGPPHHTDVLNTQLITYNCICGRVNWIICIPETTIGKVGLHVPTQHPAIPLPPTVAPMMSTWSLYTLAHQMWNHLNRLSRMRRWMRRRWRQVSVCEATAPLILHCLRVFWWSGHIRFTSILLHLHLLPSPSPYQTPLSVSISYCCFNMLFVPMSFLCTQVEKGLKTASEVFINQTCIHSHIPTLRYPCNTHRSWQTTNQNSHSNTPRAQRVKFSWCTQQPLLLGTWCHTLPDY